MATQQQPQSNEKSATDIRTRENKTGQKKSGAAGISNRPPAEEQQEQEELPPRGEAKKKTPGGHA